MEFLTHSGFIFIMNPPADSRSFSGSSAFKLAVLGDFCRQSALPKSSFLLQWRNEVSSRVHSTYMFLYFLQDFTKLQQSSFACIFKTIKSYRILSFYASLFISFIGIFYIVHIIAFLNSETIEEWWTIKACGKLLIYRWLFIFVLLFLNFLIRFCAFCFLSMT